MKLYVEFKPCYHTKYLSKFGFDKTPIVNYLKTCFVDGESNTIKGTLYLTEDLLYVYCFCSGEPSYYRVTNISSKPIVHTINKVEEWYKITKQINELKKQRKKLIQ